MVIFKQSWWKVLCIVLLIYTIVAGFLVPSPALPILHESIRNLYFHVPMWFGMTAILMVSLYFSIRFLSSNNLKDDIYSSASVTAALLFGVLGLLTGMQWAKSTWGAWWTNDPKLMGAAVGLLIYLAYFVLRNSINDIDKKAKVSAVFNIMAFAIYISSVFIVPRLTDSLHPGNGGNPGFNSYDLDGTMRLVFWPAVLGWTLLAGWITTLAARIRIVEMSLMGDQNTFHSNLTNTNEILDSLLPDKK